MINPSEKPNEKNLSEVLMVEIRSFKESVTDFKRAVEKGFTRLEESFVLHQKACREDMKDVYGRISELEKASGRVNWGAIKAVAAVAAVILALVTFTVITWMTHLQYEKKATPPTEKKASYLIHQNHQRNG